MKKNHLVAGVVLSVIAALVTADYFMLFGTKVTYKSDFIELTFKPVDEETGAPVVDVHVRCFQKDNRNACTEKMSGKAGFLAVNVPVIKIVTRSYLFQKDVRYQETVDPKLHIMFIHYDYANPVETFIIQDLPALSGKVMTIPMPKPLLSN